MAAFDGLIFDGWVPPAVEEKHIVCSLQIQPDPTHLVVQEQYMDVRIRLELIEDSIKPSRVHAALYQGSFDVRLRELVGQPPQSKVLVNELSEDQGLAAAFDNVLEFFDNEIRF